MPSIILGLPLSSFDKHKYSEDENGFQKQQEGRQPQPPSQFGPSLERDTEALAKRAWILDHCTDL